jgi:hypothetical protein
MPHPLPPEWVTASEAHTQAVALFASAARAVESACWQRPLAEGKWSPAEITMHLIEAYGVLRGELAGRPGMRMLGTAPRRWLLRHLVLPRLLRGAPFPRVRAPLETRPVTVLTDQAAAVSRLEREAAEFAAELAAREAAAPVWLTHAYFGRIPALHGLRLAAVHTGHHARQLARAA